jgi:hypothetical protein
MTQTIKRHGVVVTLPDEPDFPGVSEAEREHLLARLPRHRLDYRLEYKGYPGHVELIPVKDNLWRFRLGYGFNYYLAEMLSSPSAYATVDAALDAAIKMFVEGRKLSKGKPQRDASAMRVAQAEKEKRKRGK